MKQTTTRQFDVYAPGTKDRAPRLLQTIDVEVETRSGHEFLTQESRLRIEEIKRSDRGLITGAEIKSMRKRLGLSQEKLTNLIQCGEKSLSRWENGHGYPTGPINAILRLLSDGILTPEYLERIYLPSATQVKKPIISKPRVPSWKPLAIPSSYQVKSSKATDLHLVSA